MGVAAEELALQGVKACVVLQQEVDDLSLYLIAGWGRIDDFGVGDAAGCLVGMVEDFQLHGLAVGGEVVVGLADVLVDVLRKRGDIGFVGGKLRQGDVETGALDGFGRQRRHDPGQGGAARHVGEAERHPLAGGLQVGGYCLHHLLVALVGVGTDHIEHAADPEPPHCDIGLALRPQSIVKNEGRAAKRSYGKYPHGIVKRIHLKHGRISLVSMVYSQQ